MTLDTLISLADAVNNAERAFEATSAEEAEADKAADALNVLTTPELEEARARGRQAHNVVLAARSTLKAARRAFLDELLSGRAGEVNLPSALLCFDVDVATLPDLVGISVNRAPSFEALKGLAVTAVACHKHIEEENAAYAAAHNAYQEERRRVRGEGKRRDDAMDNAWKAYTAFDNKRPKSFRAAEDATRTAAFAAVRYYLKARSRPLPAEAIWVILRHLDKT